MRLAAGLRVNESDAFNEIAFINIDPVNTRPLTDDEKIAPSAHSSHEIHSHAISELLFDAVLAHVEQCGVVLSPRALTELHGVKHRVSQEIKSVIKA